MDYTTPKTPLITKNNKISYKVINTPEKVINTTEEVKVKMFKGKPKKPKDFASVF